MSETTYTYSCLLCGYTTPWPHVCPAFYPELYPQLTAKPDPK